MIQLAGEELFELPPDRLWQSLTQPEFLCQCFPGVDSVVRSDDRSATVMVRPGFSFVRGTLELTFEFVETQPTSRARVAIRLKGIGSSAELEAEFALAPSAGGTQVKWTAHTVQLVGLLKAVSQGLMQAAAQRVAADTWALIHQRLLL